MDHVNMNASRIEVVGNQTVCVYIGECAVCGKNFETTGETRYCSCEDQ